MTDDGIPLQDEPTDRPLTTFIDTYTSIFPSRQSFDPWTDLWAKDADGRSHRYDEPGAWWDWLRQRPRRQLSQGYGEKRIE